MGVRLDAYLLSKLCVLSALAAVQVGLLTAIVLALRPIDGSPADAVLLLVILLLTALCALAMGLAVSAAATSQDQATSFVPLVLVPQLFFAGAIIPVAKMTAPIEAVSQVVFARWPTPCPVSPWTSTRSSAAGAPACTRTSSTPPLRSTWRSWWPSRRRFWG